MSLISAALPPPVAFDLDAAECARLNDAYVAANGGGLPMAFATFALGLQSPPPILRLYRSYGNDPADWVLLTLLVVTFGVVLSALGFPKEWRRLLVRSQPRTVVTFDDFGITVVRGGARPARAKRIALAGIRSIRRMPEALFLFGRQRPIVTIVLGALPDDGAQIMSFLEERLVATRMLRRSSLRTTIVNTVSP